MPDEYRERSQGSRSCRYGRNTDRTEAAGAEEGRRDRSPPGLTSPAVHAAERVTDTERHVAEITERGYTVVHGVLAREDVADFLGDTQRLQRELPTVIANSTTIVKGFRRSGQAVPEVVDHDWVRIDNLLLHGERYERLPVHPSLLPVVECVLGRDCLLSWCMTSNQLPRAIAQRMHCDDEMYPLPRPHQPLLCNALIGLCDFTAENDGDRRA